MRKRVPPQNKKVGCNFSLEQRVIDAVTEKAELAGISDSSLVNAILKEKFGMI